MFKQGTIRRIFKLCILIFLNLICFYLTASADTLYLKNGRSLEGFIKKEEKDEVELDVGCGTVKFKKSEIERIYKSTPEESAKIYQKWERDKARATELARLKKEAESEEVAVSKERGQIVVDAFLNNKVNASLVLDTGAALVLLTKNMAQKLGIDINKETNTVELRMADGRKVNAKQVVLESIKIQEVEANNVAAAILLDEVPEVSFKDGLLGMSFLSRFNFTLDHQNGKLIFKEPE